jgi:tRNA nucleotidyltransferase (CCA-adding enzyme)
MIDAKADAKALLATLRAQLPDRTLDALDALIDAAGSGAMFAVGGCVRDALMGREITDLDLAVEGDAPDLLRAALPGVRATVHARFRTASAAIGGVRVDLASARRETYGRPGSLPAPEPAPIDDDLRRRDFSCNAIALRLGERPELLDPCGGVSDIAARHVRVLHDRSFVDDPTRIYRAFRYAARLDFVLEPRTASLLTSGLPHVRAVGGERLRRELELMLDDAPTGAALEAAHTAGALQAVQAALHWSAAKSEAYGDERAVATTQRPQYGFALMAAGASPEEARAISARLRLKRGEAAAVTGVSALRGVSELLRRPDLKPSGAALLLDRVPEPAIAAYARTTGNSIAGGIMLRYLAEWRATRPMLRGRDLIDLGIPEGPQVQKGLQLVRAARLDGWASDRDDERALIMRFAKSIRDSTAASPALESGANGE